jgi:hypothetical protein
LLLLLDHRLASAQLFGEVKVIGRNRPKPVGYVRVGTALRYP